MERNGDFNPNMNNFSYGFSPYGGGYPPYNCYEGMNGMDPSNGEFDFFNPMMQYEQGYMYYRYLSQQLEYKIKCKEYEKLCGISNTRTTNMGDNLKK